MLDGFKGVLIDDLSVLMMVLCDDVSMQFHSLERLRTATSPPSLTWQPSLDYTSLHRPVWTTLYEYGPTTTTLSGAVAIHVQ